MLIRINFGPRKGIVQDLPRQAAEAMIADGRGVLAVPDQYPPQPVSSPKIASSKTAGKRR
jgi:hypothetical protein